MITIQEYQPSAKTILSDMMVPYMAELDCDVPEDIIRGKLADCDAFEIVTVHGLGYKAVIK